MALVGNMIATSFAGNPSVINYDMFVSVFAMLSLFYLIAICFKEQFTIHKFVPATLDLLNVLFWFCAAVAMAAELGAHSCSSSVSLRPSQMNRILLTTLSGLHFEQPHHKRISQHCRPMPRSTSYYRILVVRMGMLYRQLVLHPHILRWRQPPWRPTRP